VLFPVLYLVHGNNHDACSPFRGVKIMTVVIFKNSQH